MVDNATLLLFMVLMFIGTSPGSTGGGIKTTSIGVLAVVAGNRIRGSEANNVFRATLSDEAVTRTITVFIAAVIFILLMIFLHMVGQQGDAPSNQSRGVFIEYLFEVVSAFGTVGLSTGITTSLPEEAKWVLILCMYIGRLGDGTNPDDGIYILLKEVIDNAVDEFIMGYGKKIDIGIRPGTALVDVTAHGGAETTRE